MEIHQLRYFVAAAEAGSISRAAARLHVAQPSLSQQIKKLEDSLGIALFDRLGRGVALTEAGAALLPRAQRVLAELRAVEHDLQAELAEGRGRLAVGAIPTVAPYLLPRVLARVRARCPDAEIVIVEDLTEALVERLIDNVLDAAILSPPISDPLIRLEQVVVEPMLLVCPSVGPNAIEADAVSPEELRGMPRVSLHEMHCLGRQIEGFCTAQGLAPGISCRAAQLGTVLELVRLGLGVSIVPSLTADLDQHDGRRYLRIADPCPTRELAIGTRVGRSRSRLIGIFGEEVAAALGEPAERRPTPLAMASADLFVI